jgi:hypothetical protein
MPMNFRRLALLHRWVLAWFMLSLGVAVAAPLVHPQSLELVCSSAGMVKVVVHTEEGAQESGRLAMDCALCTVTGAPPPAAGALHAPRPLPLARAVQSIPSARIAAATRSPLPARGPPSLLS